VLTVNVLVTLPTHGSRRLRTMPLALPRSPFESYLAELLDEIRADDSGDMARYIPELGRADPNWFGIAICTVDGHVYEVGDTGVDFTIQSVSKPFIYGLALQERGLDEVLSRVGVEPSGNTFNAIVVDGSNRPFNPMVNAGAIVSTAMSRSEDQVLGLLGRFAGRDLSIDEAVYKSERITGDRNRAIGYLMSSFELMGDDATAAIDRYFRQCSVSVTCRDLAIMAGTLANRGSNPVTAVRALGEAEVESVISIMSSCGMYDASGEWMLRVGMPAKSGVSGAVIAVMPGQFGIAVFSPLLDHHFNSVRGLQVCERMSAEFTLHPMRFQADVGGVIRRIYTCTAARSSRLRPVEESAVLDDHGYLAAIVELQGELFVAAAERVLRAVTEQLETSDIIVLDFSRVTVADPAATALLERLAAELEPTDATIVFASRPDAPALEAAIEWCEDRILHQYRPDALGGRDAASFHAQELLRDLDDDVLGAIAMATTTVALEAGDVLFKQGDLADSVYFIRSGALAVMLPLDGIPGNARRVARLGPGLAVGEMAIVGDHTRSADVVAVAASDLAELRLADLDELTAVHPDVTHQIHLNLARVLADRLRSSNEQLRLLAR
jgi:glutaminase